MGLVCLVGPGQVELGRALGQAGTDGELRLAGGSVAGPVKQTNPQGLPLAAYLVALENSTLASGT